jgi:hypothetical protein
MSNKPKEKEQNYAGATFETSPAPSSIPVPIFSSEQEDLKRKSQNLMALLAQDQKKEIGDSLKQILGLE